jgi:hypothetical protein
MENLLCTHLAPMLVEGRPLDHLWLQRVVGLGYELPRQSLDDCSRIDAMR